MYGLHLLAHVRIVLLPIFSVCRLLPEEDGRREVLTRQVTQYMDRAEQLKPKKTLKVTVSLTRLS